MVLQPLEDGGAGGLVLKQLSVEIGGEEEVFPLKDSKTTFGGEKDAEEDDVCLCKVTSKVELTACN